MSMIASARINPDAPALVAPRWHTALLIVLFLSLAAGGAFMQRQAQGQPATPAEHPSVIPVYLSLIAVEWGLLFYVWKGGLRRGGTTLGELIGGRWSGAGDALRDGALALGAWAVWMGFEQAWAWGFGPDPAASIQALLPRRTVEILLWIGVSISAGVVEETVFRGYFQRQFEALTRSRAAALILQAALFGISHGYQGLRASLKIAVFGALFGALAVWRKSLRPGMMAHAWTDIAAGIFRL